MTGSKTVLRGVSDIRAFFRTNETPIYFVSPTAFNLLGIDRWVRKFFYVNYFDSFEGAHPRVVVPTERVTRDFTSMEDVNNWLLASPEVGDVVRRHEPEDGPRGKAVFVMFDEKTEELADKLGLDVAHPPAELRHRLDSKIVTTQMGDEAGVPSVPNVLGRASSHAELLSLAKQAKLGRDLVVQMPYGDSGKTTFFIKTKADWAKYAAKHPLAEQELKVMRRINCRAVAVEAVLTRHGTLVGPVMMDLTGHPELTPYAGGWCGNDMYPNALTGEQRVRARELTEKLGARLAEEGYRGFFEVDYLVDVDTGELYLGELNPRISGVSPMTNVTAGAYADMPLFLFHLLEYLDVDYEIDVDELNERWSRPGSVDVWSQLVIKQIDDGVEQITTAPKTGMWYLDDRGRVSFARWGNDWHSLQDDTDAFFLRVLGPGDYRYKGADLGILVTRARLQTDDNRLTGACRQWLAGIKTQFEGTPVVAVAEEPLLPRPRASVKSAG
jgi:biotin carboxylase